jgi:hypothetical protein
MKASISFEKWRGSQLGYVYIIGFSKLWSFRIWVGPNSNTKPTYKHGVAAYGLDLTWLLSNGGYRGQAKNSAI